MFSDWDDYTGDDDVLELVKRYHDMRSSNRIDYFDIDEFESIIEYYLNEYNYQEAVTAINLALRQHPCALSVRLKNIQVLIETGRPSRALDMIRKVEKIEPSNYQVYLFKGIALNITGKSDEALKSFNCAIDLCNDNQDDLLYSVAQSFLQTGQFVTANSFLLRAHDVDRTNVLVLYDLAENFERLDQFDESLEFYRKYLDVDPFAEQVWNNLGLLCCKTGRYMQAAEAFDFATAINPNHFTAYMNKADMLVGQNDHTGAIEIYREILEKDAENTHALCSLGDCYEETGNYSEALKAYNHAIALYPDFSDAWFGKGLVFLKIKRYSQSISSIKRALLYEPENPDCWFMLGELYSRMNKDIQAVEAYKEAVKINPLDHEAWLACAQVFFRKRKICEAISTLSESFEFIGENPTLHYRLAAYHAYQKDFNTAIVHFEQGLMLNYSEYQEMFRLFPKTREYGIFYALIEEHQHKVKQKINH